MLKFWTNIQVVKNLFISVQASKRQELKVEKQRGNPEDDHKNYPALSKHCETRFNSHVTSMASVERNEEVLKFVCEYLHANLMLYLILHGTYCTIFIPT